MNETGNINPENSILLNDTLKHNLNYLALPESDGDNQDVEINKVKDWEAHIANFGDVEKQVYVPLVQKV